MIIAKSSWLIPLSSASHPRSRLFCIPYAGAGASIFRGWPGGLPAGVEVWAVQPPGRGARIRETPYHQFEPYIQELSEAIIPHLDLPYAIFGHSLGAIIAFELARKLRKIQREAPNHLFVSASPSPHLMGKEGRTSGLSDQEFVERLRTLNGTPRQVLENKELLQVLLPTLRADFSVLENYEYIEADRLESKITVYGGTQDPETNLEQLEAWRGQTRSLFKVQLIPGDHFFLHSAQALLLRSIRQELDLR
jgi:medium-chain acyl-[acyl-carrier-protein] hydrolase